MIQTEEDTDIARWHDYAIRHAIDPVVYARVGDGHALMISGPNGADHVLWFAHDGSLIPQPYPFGTP